MSDDLTTDLTKLAEHLERAGDDAVAQREARLLRRAIQAINGLSDELAPYRVFNSDAKSYDKIPQGLIGDAIPIVPKYERWGGTLNIGLDVLDSIVKPDKPKDDDPNAHVEGAPV